MPHGRAVAEDVQGEPGYLCLRESKGLAQRRTDVSKGHRNLGRFQHQNTE